MSFLPSQIILTFVSHVCHSQRNTWKVATDNGEILWDAEMDNIQSCEKVWSPLYFLHILLYKWWYCDIIQSEICTIFSFTVKQEESVNYYKVNEAQIMKNSGSGSQYTLVYPEVVLMCGEIK